MVVTKLDTDTRRDEGHVLLAHTPRKFYPLEEEYAS